MTSYQPEDAARAAPAKLGRYELLGHLATGGMAEIHLARISGEAGFERIVVVKRLLPELVASPAFVAMFLDEGKLVARLDHPNVCEVYELGRDGVEYFLAMPFLDGVPVTELIARPRESDRIGELRIATGVIAQACAGLHHAHELHGADRVSLGLVHRDVSPSNLFATSAGVVKVLDFGVAKVRGATETEAGTVKGKTQYMAPEQLLGEPLDRRCDVFALGIVLFELATHQRLFKRPSDFLAAKAILEEPIPRADAVDPAIPQGVADVIAKALARNRDERYPDARALERAIVTAMVDHGGIAAPAEIAQVIVATDELTVQRTRQARVIGTARGALVGPADTATPIMRGKHPRLADDGATEVTTAAHARSIRIPLAIGLGVVAVIVIAALVIGRTDPSVTRDVTALSSNSDRAADAMAEATPASTDAGTPALTDAMVGGTPAMTDAGIELASDGRSAESVAPDAAVIDPLPRRARSGTLSVDSTPYATIYVDGRSLGVTPLLRQSLPAGKHQLRAVLRDGRTKRLTVDVPAGRAAPPIVLTW